MIPRRNAVLYTLVEGDVMIDESGNHEVTDGEVWIYADGTVQSRGAVTRNISDGSDIVARMKVGKQVINLSTLEEV